MKSVLNYANNFSQTTLDYFFCEANLTAVNNGVRLLYFPVLHYAVKVCSAGCLSLHCTALHCCELWYFNGPTVCCVVSFNLVYLLVYTMLCTETLHLLLFGSFIYYKHSLQLIISQLKSIFTMLLPPPMAWIIGWTFKRYINITVKSFRGILI